MHESYDSYNLSPAQAARQLMREIGRTGLGRNLLRYLEDQGIEVVVTEDVPPVLGAGAVAGGGYMPAEKKIYLDPRAGIDRLIHFFAHETRHVAQTEQEMARNFSAAMFEPEGWLLNARLMEMDADAFAVYFVFNHARETGSEIFNTLSQNASWRDKPGSLEADRAPLYNAFYGAWVRNGREYEAGAMQATALAWLDNEQLVAAYNNSALETWRGVAWQALTMNAQSEGSPFAQAFAEAVRVAPAAQALLTDRASGYTGLFVEFGVPDYVAEEELDGFTQKLASGAAPLSIGASRELRRAKDDFTTAAMHYLDMAQGSPAPMRSQPVHPATPT